MGVAGHQCAGINSCELRVAVAGAHHGGAGAKLADPAITGDGIREIEGIGLVKIDAVVRAIAAREGDVTHDGTGAVGALITTKVQVSIRADSDRVCDNHGSICHGHRTAPRITDREGAAIRPEGTRSIHKDRVVCGGCLITHQGTRGIDFAPIGDHQTIIATLVPHDQARGIRPYCSGTRDEHRVIGCTSGAPTDQTLTGREC